VDNAEKSIAVIARQVNVDKNHMFAGTCNGQGLNDTHTKH